MGYLIQYTQLVQKHNKMYKIFITFSLSLVSPLYGLIYDIVGNCDVRRVGDVPTWLSYTANPGRPPWTLQN